MASAAERAAVTAAYIARQRLIRSRLARDLVLLLRQLFDRDQPGPAWAATKVALDTLIRDRRAQSAGLAARYYLDVRRTSLPQPTPVVAERRRELPRAQQSPAAADLQDILAVENTTADEAWAELERITGVEPPPPLDGDRVDSNLNATGIAVYQRALRSGKTPAQAVDTMAVTLTGAATTLTLEGGREVVRDAATADDEAIGWLRVPDADPCSWCAMLASRGAVYRSAASAGQVKDTKFTGDGQFKWHNHCGCNAIPIFDPDDPHLDRAEDLYDEWLRVTRGHSGKAAVKVWRQHWENRD